VCEQRTIVGQRGVGVVHWAQPASWQCVRVFPGKLGHVRPMIGARKIETLDSRASGKSPKNLLMLDDSYSNAT
jgi:hypothetical protein